MDCRNSLHASIESVISAMDSLGSLTFLELTRIIPGSSKFHALLIASLVSVIEESMGGVLLPVRCLSSMREFDSLGRTKSRWVPLRFLGVSMYLGDSIKIPFGLGDSTWPLMSTWFRSTANEQRIGGFLSDFWVYQCTRVIQSKFLLDLGTPLDRWCSLGFDQRQMMWFWEDYNRVIIVNELEISALV